MQSYIDLILSRTNGGRDLIEECHPEFAGVADEKMVKLRSEEKEASAHIHKVRDRYILKDFGSGEKGGDGIKVFADHHGMEYKDAVHMLAVRYGLHEDKAVQFGPKIETLPLSGELKYGERKFVYKSEFTKQEIQFLGGKHATEEVLRMLNWHSLEYMVICQDDKEVKISSTPWHPIFARELHDVKTGDVIGRKIYQPKYKSKGDDKDYKFSYYPKGLQPGTYVHGLWELQQEVKEGEKVGVVICSGERDAIVVKSMGYYPIWLNSETMGMPSALIAYLKTVSDRIYYIPDIDKTGRERALTNLKLYPELYTVWLPEEMATRMGDGMKPCKDLRDWAGIHQSKGEFYHLLNTAKCYQFWTYDEKGRPQLSLDSLMYFLNINGFHRMWNKAKKAYEFVRVQGHIVQSVTIEEIRTFVIDWSQTQPEAIRNMLLKGRKNAIEQMKDLPVKQLDMNSATVNSQVFCFLNKQIMVTDEDICEIDKDSECYFWEDKVINHDIKLLPPMFEYDLYTDDDGKKYYRIVPMTDTCKLFMVMIRTSMIYWQKIENGEELTEEEEKIENKSLAAKLFFIGHNMHRKRIKTRDWAALFMDNNTKPDSDTAEGGSAKTFLFSDVLPNCGYHVVIIKPSEINPLKDKFLFDQVDFDTDIICFDECPLGFMYDMLNSEITGSIVVNQKNNRKFTIGYENAPKIDFITNFVPSKYGGSDERRRGPQTMSDYYHHATETNGHKESRTIRDDFGMVLMDDKYPEEDWNRDLNFLLQCEKFYLDAVSTINDKLEPDMRAIKKRHASSVVTSEFDGWADKYYGNPEHLNCAILADSLVADYNTSDFGRVVKLDKKKLKAQLRAWVGCHDGLEFNPKDVCNDKHDRRIKCKDSNGVNTEKFYIAGTYEG